MFPANTGRRISRFSRWLQEREKDLNEAEVVLDSDLQCGDVVHLFSLVYPGEISIFPRLPEEGVGEAGEPRNLKRGRVDVDESPDSSKTKKSKYIADSDVFARREKGFPGIRVCARREAIQRAKILELSLRDLVFDSKKAITSDHIHDKLDTDVNQEESASTRHSHIGGTITSHSPCNITADAAESPWNAMACYAEKVMLVTSDPEHPSSLQPEVFKAVYAAIQRSGDQGLSMEEVSQNANKSGKNAASFFCVARNNALVNISNVSLA